MVNTFSLAFLTIQKSLMMREPHLPESKRRQAHRQTDRQADRQTGRQTGTYAKLCLAPPTW